MLASSALAIDGNYASPYASQWDSRSAGLSIPGFTWLGFFFLLVNGLAAFGYALRHRLRIRKARPG